jgi:methyltransferase (TIGR00027 family)
MREGVASRTAQIVSAYRLTCPRLPSDYGDPGADDRLAEDVGAGGETGPGPRMAGYLRFRTAFFDRFVVDGIERGAIQVAVIGAGYDGRALRYGKPDVRWFEVDHPATQRDKRERLARLGIAAPGITFVAADLIRDDVAVLLTAAGFVPDAPTLMLCEGVAVYLPPTALAALLTRLRSIATPGTRLALSAGSRTTEPERRARFAAHVAAMGEPMALGDADVPAMLTAARWRAVELSERSQRAGLLVGVPV